MAGIVCSYPPQARTVRRPKKAQGRSSSKPDAVLLERIEKLEGLLKERSILCDNEPADIVADESRGERDERVTQASDHSPHDTVTRRPPNLQTPGDRAAPAMYPCLAASPVNTTELSWKPSGYSPPSDTQRDGPAQLADGDEYWKRIEEECASEVFLKTPSSSKSDSNVGSSGPKRPTFQRARTGIAFPFPGSDGDVRLPLLSIRLRQVCWRRYLTNVDPILKILHKSTTQELILRRDENTLDAPSHALVQALCLLAVTSMSDADVAANFESDKESVAQHCATLTEHALVLAKFLEARDLSTIQALLLFLYYLRCVHSPRLNAMCGMAVFLAVRAGLNRDGASSDLSCLEVELRRRTWWQLVNLVDHPDDFGLDYFPFSLGADTRLPLNVNDDELESQVVSPGEERTGFTESSFCLMQYEVTRTFHQIKMDRVREPLGRKFRSEDADQHLQSSRDLMRNKYLQGNGGMDASVVEYAADVIAMILAKRRVLMYIFPDRNRQGDLLPPDAQDHLFLLAIHVLELSRKLQTNRNSERWRWLSATYFQWSIAAFVVRNLTIRLPSPATNRAWRVVDGLLDLWPPVVRNYAKSNALRALLIDAMRARETRNLRGSHLSTWSDRDLCFIPPSPLRHQAVTEDKRTESPSGIDQLKWVNPHQEPVTGHALNQATGFDGLDASDFDVLDELSSGIDLGLLW
ncbi:uncharacterized protein Z519_02619 [Cladophialophora bantiana CBS 173.52]|uniref:Xylanolytic transcriptional activator regulatory domain-containing protein n=1 Tax=Cladophialophora bantiana (strain ATCC 10958 / CBS 173.52 / CDC B-1940 / NIH 8579) TaxID=1442370 RepID=A0A0D2GFR3_CLAB1|nr:uncharacterized protein Z519_02619 [Cladophialophora bantiana CBS 173.52]KIW97227.1 hypothetical protein Z519_02619 [Cladophialophora bantiana CBS 173.52]